MVGTWTEHRKNSSKDWLSFYSKSIRLYQVFLLQPSSLFVLLPFSSCILPFLVLAMILLSEEKRKTGRCSAVITIDVIFAPKHSKLQVVTYVIYVKQAFCTFLKHLNLSIIKKVMLNNPTFQLTFIFTNHQPLINAGGSSSMHSPHYCSK